MTPICPNWSFIIFCYNEVGTIDEVIRKTISVGEQMAPGKFEVIIVDDGSTDGSSQCINDSAAESDFIRVISHPKNQGIGKALISGYTHAKGIRICAIPADGQFNLEELLPFSDFSSGNVISFTRKEKRYSVYRQALTAFNGLSNRFLLGLNLRDVNWVKAYHAKDLKGISISMKSSLVESEICAKLKIKGVSFIEAPSSYLERRSGHTKGGAFRTVTKALGEFLFLVVHVNWFRFNLYSNRLFGPSESKKAQ